MELAEPVREIPEQLAAKVALIEALHRASRDAAAAAKLQPSRAAQDLSEIDAILGELDGEVCAATPPERPRAPDPPESPNFGSSTPGGHYSADEVQSLRRQVSDLNHGVKALCAAAAAQTKVLNSTHETVQGIAELLLKIAEVVDG